MSPAMQFAFAGLIIVSIAAVIFVAFKLQPQGGSKKTRLEVAERETARQLEQKKDRRRLPRRPGVDGRGLQ